MEKSQKTRVVVLLIAVAGLVAAAYFTSQTDTPFEVSERPGATTTSSGSQEEPRATTTNETFSVERGRIDEQNERYTLQIDYPVGEAPGAQVVENTIRRNARNFTSQAQSAENAGVNPYEKITEFEAYEYENRYSYVVETYEYTGGATGIAVISAFVFDENGNRLELVDFFENDRAQNVFLSDVKDALFAEVDEQGLFPESIRELTFEDLQQNFYITATGVNLVFSQYSIAPGASGVIRVTLPNNIFS